MEEAQVLPAGTEPLPPHPPPLGLSGEWPAASVPTLPSPMKVKSEPHPSGVWRLEGGPGPEPQLQEERPLSDPTEGPLRRESPVTGPVGRRSRNLLQDISHPCHSAKEKLRNRPHPELLLFSRGLPSTATPPNFLLLSQKITFLSFVCWAGLWFCPDLHVPKYNFSVFLK